MVTKFQLSKNFISKYEDKEPNWGYGDLSKFVFMRTYSRTLENGLKETPFQVFKRVVEGTFQLQLDHCTYMGLPWDAAKAQRSAQEMFRRMWAMKFLPPGRGLWMQGTDKVSDIGSAALCNCGFVSTKDITKDPGDPFAWACDMLMLGVGIGFDTLGAGKFQPFRPDNGIKQITIEDSREGWVNAIKRLINSYTSSLNPRLVFDYSEIRPAGSLIKGFGGTASGYKPLKEGIENIRKILNIAALSGRALTAVDITDIMNFIGKFVVAGNVRRSAELAIGSEEDKDFQVMKDWKLFPEELKDRRWASNNSLSVNESSNFEEFVDSILLNGEPGLVFLTNSRKYGRLKDGVTNIDNEVMGFNPCVEITLHDRELCVGENTLIHTDKGLIPIRELSGGSHKVFNGKDWSESKVFYTGIANLYRVTLSDGSYLDATKDHKWLVKTSKNKYKEVKTKDLASGMKLPKAELFECHDGKDVKSAYTWGFFAGDGFIDGKYTLMTVQASEYNKILPELDGELRKEQHPEGYTNPFSRFRTTTIPLPAAEILRDSKKGLAPEILTWNSKSLKKFFGGWIDADGAICGNKELGNQHYRLYGTESKLREAQILLRRIGVNQASIRLFAKAGTETNKGTRSYDLWYLTIPSYDTHKIDTKLKVLPKTDNRYRTNPAHPNTKIDKAKVQKVVSIDLIQENADTYCFEEPELHQGLFANVLTKQCNLVESFPANHDSAEDYYETIKYAYLYAKSVTLLRCHNPESNSAMLRNRRIGLSQSGIQQAIKKFGTRNYFKNFCDKAYEVVSEYDNVYSRWLGIPRSIKMTTVKPSGTVSLLAGATPGVHCTHSEYYMRTVRIANTDPLLEDLRKAGYKIEESITDREHTSVVYFPVKENNYTKSKYDISIWEQLALVKELQYSWADNSVSVTVTIRPGEEDQLLPAIEYYAPYLKSVSFLPLDNHNYEQAPYSTITEDEYKAAVAMIKPLDISVGDDAVGSKFCEGDRCEI